MIWPPDIKAAEAIEAGVQVVMPGMVNTHAHISASAISGEASAAEHVIVFPFSGQPVPAGFADQNALLAAADGAAFVYAQHAETDAVPMCYTTTASQTDGDEARTLRPLQVTAITYRIAPGRAQGTMY